MIDITAGPKSPDSTNGAPSERFTRRHTARISIRDRFKKNLAKVIDEANTAEQPDEEHQHDDQIYSMEPPPLPRRGKFGRINR